MGAKAQAHSNNAQRTALFTSIRGAGIHLKRSCPYCHGKGTLTYHYHTEAYCGYCGGNVTV